MSSAEVAICLRAKSASVEKVQAALWKQRSIVKTWTARGTLHLVRPDDMPLWSAALQARGEYWAKSAWAKYHGISANDMRLMLDCIDEALEGKSLTREELAAAVAKVAKKPALAERTLNSWGSTLKPAAFAGKLCFGPNRGRNVTFVAPRDWVGERDEVDADDALAELLFRYVETYGPSTREDFTRWMGHEPKLTRRAFAAAGDELQAIDRAGTEAFITQAGARTLLSHKPGNDIHVLPAFDPYVVGVLKHLEDLLPDPALRSKVSRAAGWISPVILCGGRIVGVWRYERKTKSIDISVETFLKLGAAEKRVMEQKLEVARSLLTRAESDETSNESRD